MQYEILEKDWFENPLVELQREDSQVRSVWSVILYYENVQDASKSTQLWKKSEM